QNILDKIIELGEMKINSLKNFKGSLESSFAHGDFCPWNLMTSNDQILIYDWEFAGDYPLGYDLFTFIFQTNFLLKPKKNIEAIIIENEHSILSYFKSKNSLDWKSYLIEFAKLKVEFELNKGTNKLISNYKALLEYVEKA
ncbi:MAG: phosphotransferase, partial [Lutibacter sp.]